MHEHLLVAHLILILKRKQLVEQNGRKTFMPRIVLRVQEQYIQGKWKGGYTSRVSNTSYSTAQASGLWFCTVGMAFLQVTGRSLLLPSCGLLELLNHSLQGT